MLTEEYGKVGSKGELYPSKKIRKQIGLKPNNHVKYRITSKGHLLVEKIESVENLLDKPKIATVTTEEIEKLSEEKQKQGYSNETKDIS